MLKEDHKLQQDDLIQEIQILQERIEDNPDKETARILIRENA